MSKLLDPCVPVMKALIVGLRVDIGDYTYQYDPDEEEVFIVGKTSSGEEVFLRTETLSLNGFIRMVHRELTEGQRIAVVSQLSLLKDAKTRGSTTLETSS